ncbi:DUF924-domain-containing protein [Stemphylium lycopersici]|nr:DUF924-domain-containing protein [Stemphylium lycopersici]
MSTSRFSLDPSLFNRTLYNRVTDLWFTGIDKTGQTLDMSVAKRWFVPTPEERDALDAQFRTEFSRALEAIGPEKLPGANAQPLLDELQRVAEKDAQGNTEEVAWTALSLVLLLDQMPRNIYRTEEGLRRVYTHYDPMAYSLVRSLLSPSSALPRPDTHPAFRLSSALRAWFYMPLMHSEDLAAHDLFDDVVGEFAQELNALEGYQGSKIFLDKEMESGKEHRDILERFGRYPHRNKALGRESTREEEMFMEGGGATFGVGQGDDGV